MILADKGIISKDKVPVCTKMVKYRNRLTHFYNGVNNEEVHDIIQNHLGDFEAFIKDILLYSENNK